MRAANTTETRIEERFAHEPKPCPSHDHRPTMKKTSETRATRLTTRRQCRKNSCATVRDERPRGELQMRDSVDCLSLLSGMSSHPTWRPQGWSLHAARRQIQEMRGGAGEDADELEDTRRDEQHRGVHEQIENKHANPFTCGSVADILSGFRRTWYFCRAASGCRPCCPW